MNHKYFTKFHL